jgi:probable phosphoglycerate mutase
MKLPFDGTVRRRIHLMRHGDVAYFTPDGQRVADVRAVSLTEKGRNEALAMRDMLAAAPFDRAVCSGLPRTVETAAIVLGGRQVPLEEIPALEEIRGGDAAARAKLSPADYAYAMYHAAQPGRLYAAGEAFTAFEARVLDAFTQILRDPHWTSLLLVLHGVVNRAILGHATGAGLKGFGAFEQDTGCLNVLDVDADPGGDPVRFTIRALNVTPSDPVKMSRTMNTMELLTMRAYPAAGRT